MQEPCDTINEDIPAHAQPVTAIPYLPTPPGCATIETTQETATEEQHPEGQTFSVYYKY